MYFLTEDDNLLKKHNTRWDKVSAVIKREFNIEPISSKKFLETKILQYVQGSNGRLHNIRTSQIVIT